MYAFKIHNESASDVWNTFTCCSAWLKIEARRTCTRVNGGGFYNAAAVRPTRIRTAWINICDHRIYTCIQGLCSYEMIVVRCRYIIV